MRSTSGDTIADDFEFEAITIPQAAAVTVQSLRTAQDYDDRIMGWEIIDNTGGFDVAKVVGLSPKTSPIVGVGFAPPTAKKSLETTFVKSTEVGDITAVLVVYTASETVRVPREPTVSV